jgi:beta-1,4-mannosyltransferase
LRDQHRFAVIPHGNYLDSYPDEIPRAAARRKLALDDSRLVFLFLGAVRPYKGILELLAAFRRQAPRDAVLVIAGEPLDADFSRRIEEAVADADNMHFYPGFVPNREVQVYMNASDVVVLPYRNVLSSGAALLAMSFGKPCVAPATGCLTDVLDSSGAFLYDPGVETGLTESLRQAVEAREMLASMGEHNRQKASEWTWERAAQATKALYDGCLSDGPATGCNR